MTRTFLAICVACTMLTAGLLHASGAASAETRVALVVGNAAYKNAPALKNPVNDARDMAKVLRELGFDVIRVENGTKQQLEHAIGEFSAKLTEGGVGLFYYSGHGLQENGHNYLIPVDAELASEAAVRIETTDVDLVLDLMSMAQTRVNLVILDACRSNPFERRFRGLGRGLAPVEQAPRGTLIAYSTAPGKVASDGDGANGLYTAELLRTIREPGLTVEQVFKTVRIAVGRVSNDNQTPWESSSLTGDFFFKAPLSVTPAPTSEGADIAYWDSVRGTGQRAMFEAYLKQFPNGRFSELAKLKIAELSTQSANVEKAAGPPPVTSPSITVPAPASPPRPLVTPPTQTTMLPPSPPAQSGEGAFRCPRRITKVTYSTGLELRFTNENGFRCTYWYGSKTAEKIAAFADNPAFLDAGLAKLWPLNIGNEQKFSINAGGGYFDERFIVLRRETIEVPGGGFDTFVVEWDERARESHGGSEIRRLFWYAPDLGLVVKSTVTATGTVGAGTAAIGGDYEALSVVWSPAVGP